MRNKGYVDGLITFERELSKDYAKGVKLYKKTRKNYRRNVVLTCWKMAVARRVLIDALMDERA